MADDKDLADENGKKGGRGGLVTILVAVLVASLVAGGGTFAALYFTGVIGGKAEQAAEAEAAKAVEEHMPVIRNSLVMLFSGQKYEDVATREGKERLRQQTLAEIRKVLEERTGKPGIEDVYFTAFVMQ